MKMLLKTPELLTSEYTISFLKQTDEKKYKQKVKEAENMLKPTKIEEHVNLEGKDDIRVTEEHKFFSHYMSEYIDSTSNVYFKYF